MNKQIYKLNATQKWGNYTVIEVKCVENYITLEDFVAEQELTLTPCDPIKANMFLLVGFFQGEVNNIITFKDPQWHKDEYGHLYIVARGTVLGRVI
jgi:hypothetical protein